MENPTIGNEALESEQKGAVERQNPQSPERYAEALLYRRKRSSNLGGKRLTFGSPLVGMASSLESIKSWMKLHRRN